MSRERIKGECGDRMIEAAMLALLPASSSGISKGWSGPATDLGLQCPRSDWRNRMHKALEAAFEELLKEPRP